MSGTNTAPHRNGARRELEAFDRNMNAIAVKKALEIGKAIAAVGDRVVAYAGFDNAEARTRTAEAGA